MCFTIPLKIATVLKSEASNAPAAPEPGLDRVTASHVGLLRPYWGAHENTVSVAGRAWRF